jgi:hypothetical protein
MAKGTPIKYLQEKPAVRGMSIRDEMLRPEVKLVQCNQNRLTIYLQYRSRCHRKGYAHDVRVFGEYYSIAF